MVNANDPSNPASGDSAGYAGNAYGQNEANQYYQPYQGTQYQGAYTQPQYAQPQNVQPQYAQQPYAQPQYAQQPYSQTATPPSNPYDQEQYASAQPASSYAQPQLNYAAPAPQYQSASPYQGAPQYQGAGALGLSDKSKLAAGLLGIFLGGFGVHNFYLGYTTKAVIQLVISLCTVGIGAIWGFIEGILILCSSAGSPWHRDALGRELLDNA